jgi:PAS domain S-box-containing protein
MGLLDAIPYLCLALDRDGRIVYANVTARAALDSKPATLVGRAIDELLPAASRKAFAHAVRQCAADGTPSGVDVKLSTADSPDRDIHFSISTYSPDGRKGPPVIIATGRDISAQKRKDLEFIRFYNLAHNTVNPLEITDIDGRIIYVNPAFEKASGYSRDELIGRNPSIFSSGKHPAAFWKKVWETIGAGKVWNGEVENRRRNGEPFYTHLLISPILEPDGSVVGYLGIHRDITEQKYLEKQLVHAQKMESMGLLTAGIAHEVGNPLTSISSLVQVLERTTDDAFVRDKLELIKNQVNRISRIIRDLVDFSRRSNYEIELTDVNACVREAIAIVGVAKKAKSITFENTPDPRLPRLALVADQIQQVLVNVLINAVDAVDEKFRVLPQEQTTGKISCRTRVDGSDLLVEVSDNGKGIPEIHLPKIFEPFFTTKQVGEGTGLGLWVSYGIIKSFQGEISVESVEGGGTTFTIRLPLHITMR